MSSVRGPNSALTEFLRSQGISAAAIRERHLERVRRRGRRRRSGAQAGAESDEPNEPNEEETEEPNEPNEQETNQEETNDEETRRILAAGRRKRRADETPEEAGWGWNEMGGEDATVKLCSKCQVRFAVSVYTRQTEDGGYLCAGCSQEVDEGRTRTRTKRDLQTKKQRKRMAVALLDRKNYTIPSLQDYCIGTIARHIDDVQALGYIGAVNRQRIARIVTRNRKLTDTTVRLFVGGEITELDFGDCSELSSDSYDLMCGLCPHLESLTLSMCGQLSTRNLDYMASHLSRLTQLHLDGPFLVRKESWMGFLASMGGQLTGLTIKSTHRVDSEVVALLAETCTNLRQLTLSQLPGIAGGDDGEAAIHMLSNLRNLVHLELSYLGDDHNLELSRPTDQGLVVTDDAVTTVLLAVGSHLETLVLDGCVGLTDRCLVQGVRGSCSRLRRLSLQQLAQVSDQAVESVFDHFTDLGRPALREVNLARCIGLGDNAVNAVLDHSAGELAHVSLNSVPLLTLGSVQQLERCARLETLDVGFVRCVNDRLVSRLAATLKHLTLVEVFGDPYVTAQCQVRPGCRLIGRQLN